MTTTLALLEPVEPLVNVNGGSLLLAAHFQYQSIRTAGFEAGRTPPP